MVHARLLFLSIKVVLYCHLALSSFSSRFLAYTLFVIQLRWLVLCCIVPYEAKTRLSQISVYTRDGFGSPLRDLCGRNTNSCWSAGDFSCCHTNSLSCNPPMPLTVLCLFGSFDTSSILCSVVSAVGAD